ncbi:hypothetical protein PFICI_15039 [Pestalotiopsis fici W106-1]|uniref:Uncharacterized protein n=1 Tax=Pestalotiopsis fici (strain W106-1 / CGMCC3.15140) TaxID=1229662 RepID=W3WI27_PESFW|nr:uncharacterized protein PFICI_15039 [Pestalotiopsis fici W106-1]ETS73434.1 hypothetical protein PFICI_15039 [Pestalotiopsis fici W106-1]
MDSFDYNNNCSRDALDWYALIKPKRNPDITGPGCILNMCDIQILTAFALLVSAYIMASPSSSAPLTAYLWYLVVLLAWFCAITHLAGLSVLRGYFFRRPRMKVVRVSLMFLVLALLTAALVPTGFFDWTSYIIINGASWPQSPAFCYFDIKTGQNLWYSSYDHFRSLYPGWDNVVISPSLMDTNAMQTMIVTVVLLHFGFITRCVKLSQQLSSVVNRNFRQRPTMDPLLYHETMYLYGASVLTTDQSDRIAGISYIAGDTTAGGNSTQADAVHLIGAEDSSGDVNVWTFGQLVAVLLLAAPISSMIWKFVEYAVDKRVITDDLQTSDPNQRTTDAAPQSSNTGDPERIEEWPLDRHPILTGGLPTHEYREMQMGTTNTNRQNNMMTGRSERYHFPNSTWLQPLIASTFLAMIIFIIAAFLFTSFDSLFLPQWMPFFGLP